MSHLRLPWSDTDVRGQFSLFLIICSLNRFPSNSLILVLEVNKLISSLSICAEGTILGTLLVSPENNVTWLFLSHTIIICLRRLRLRKCLQRTCSSRAEERQGSNKLFWCLGDCIVHSPLIHFPSCILVADGTGENN